MVFYVFLPLNPFDNSLVPRGVKFDTCWIRKCHVVLIFASHVRSLNFLQVMFGIAQINLIILQVFLTLFIRSITYHLIK